MPKMAVVGTGGRGYQISVKHLVKQRVPPLTHKKSEIKRVIGKNQRKECLNADQIN